MRDNRPTRAGVWRAAYSAFFAMWLALLWVMPGQAVAQAGQSAAEAGGGRVSGLKPPPRRPAPAQAESVDAAAETAPRSEHAVGSVLEKMRAERKAAAARMKAREQAFLGRLEDARKRLADAQARLQQQQAQGEALEASFDAYKNELNYKAQLLNNKIGALKELFGVFQQNASDLIGAFNGSPTSIEYPDRDKWLEGFANRMKNASEVSSVKDIKDLWYELMREISARNEIVRLRAPVLDADGESTERTLVRVGAFNVITADPEPAYLAWNAGKQQPAELRRQPTGPYLGEIDAYMDSNDGLSLVSIDPTGGALLSVLIDKPTASERLDHGGLVGYMILGLGVVALILAVLKLIDIGQISLRVRAQQSHLDDPRDDNPLGRLILIAQGSRNVDSETLEMRLHDRESKETTRIHRMTVFLAIIAAVAPLMGLLGTVVGMINTFQAITLYGTGDPQTMAGGISQALITTVLGLIVAVPAVLLHAMVSARGKALVNVLKRHNAALTGEMLEEQTQIHQKRIAVSGSGAAQPAV